MRKRKHPGTEQSRKVIPIGNDFSLQHIPTVYNCKIVLSIALMHWAGNCTWAITNKLVGHFECQDG